MDIPCTPILTDITVNGRAIKAVALADQAGHSSCVRSCYGSPSGPSKTGLSRRAMSLLRCRGIARGLMRAIEIEARKAHRTLVNLATVTLLEEHLCDAGARHAGRHKSKQ